MQASLVNPFCPLYCAHVSMLFGSTVAIPISSLTDCQGALAWVEPILSGPTPTARKGASAACTQNRFVVIFGGKGVDADGKDVMKEDLLLLEMDGRPATIKVSALDIKGVKPAPRMNAMFQVRMLTMQ